MVGNRLKEFIFKRLYSELSHVEIIPYGEFIWFIDREKKYWYFRYNITDGRLLWRYGFFEDFFGIYGIDSNSFVPLISSWVEDVLNYRVNTTLEESYHAVRQVEDVLNYRVNTTTFRGIANTWMVENVLNPEKYEK